MKLNLLVTTTVLSLGVTAMALPQGRRAVESKPIVRVDVQKKFETETQKRVEEMRRELKEASLLRDFDPKLFRSEANQTKFNNALKSVESAKTRHERSIAEAVIILMTAELRAADMNLPKGNTANNRQATSQIDPAKVAKSFETILKDAAESSGNSTQNPADVLQEIMVETIGRIQSSKESTLENLAEAIASVRARRGLQEIEKEELKKLVEECFAG